MPENIGIKAHLRGEAAPTRARALALSTEAPKVIEQEAPAPSLCTTQSERVCHDLLACPRGFRIVGTQGGRRPTEVSTQFTGVAWQCCWTHFMRNAMAKVGHKHKDAFAKELKAVRKFDDVKTCLMEAECVAQRWEKNYPRAAQQIREQFEETLAVHDLPPEHRRRVYTTNIMERLMREVKRRTRVVGIFPNEASCDRQVGAHLLERNETWHCERMRYQVMEHLKEPLPKTKTTKRTAA